MASPDASPPQPEKQGSETRIGIKSKPPAGKDASRRIHDYLLNQKRRKEEYFLRKYGKVVNAGKEAPPKDSVSLPPIDAHREAHNAASNAPLFHAQKPIATFPHNASVVIDKAQQHTRQDRHHGATDIPYHLAPTSHLTTPHLPPILAREGSGRSLPEEEQTPFTHHPQLQSHAHLHEQQHPHGAPSPALLLQQQLQQRQAQLQNNLQQAQARLQQQGVVDGSMWGSGHAGPFGGHAQQGAYAGGAALEPLSAATSKAQSLGLHPSKALSGALSGVGEAGEGKQGKKGGMRDLELELSVVKAIKGREEIVERLRVASMKVNNAYGGSAPPVLNLMDPLMKMFFRLVGLLRHRTLDAIEAIGAWHRRTESSEPFMYANVGNYLAHIGRDLAFLDEMPFMQHRLFSVKAVEDPFLTEVTPDGVPIDAASTIDLRRGGVKFTADALRIRMARKILHIHGGHGRPPGGDTPIDQPASTPREQQPSSASPANTAASHGMAGAGMGGPIGGEFGAYLGGANAALGFQPQARAGTLPPLKEESSVWGRESCGGEEGERGEERAQPLQPVTQQLQEQLQQHEQQWQQQEQQYLQQQQQEQQQQQYLLQQQQQQQQQVHHEEGVGGVQGEEAGDESFEARQQREEVERALQAQQQRELAEELERQQQRVQQEWQQRDLEDQMHRQQLEEEEAREFQREQEEQRQQEAAEAEEREKARLAEEARQQEEQQQQALLEQRKREQEEAEEKRKEEERRKNVEAREAELALQQQRQQDRERQQQTLVHDLEERQKVIRQAIAEATGQSLEQDDAQTGREADNGALIDATLNAMVCSLEEPYCSQVQPGTFTYEGWVADRRLDASVSKHMSEPPSSTERLEMHRHLAEESHKRATNGDEGDDDVRGASDQGAGTNTASSAEHASIQQQQQQQQQQHDQLLTHPVKPVTPQLQLQLQAADVGDSKDAVLPLHVQLSPLNRDGQQQPVQLKQEKHSERYQEFEVSHEAAQQQDSEHGHEAAATQALQHEPHNEPQEVSTRGPEQPEQAIEAVVSDLISDLDRKGATPQEGEQAPQDEGVSVGV